MKEALEILAPAGRPKSTGCSCEVLAQGDLNCGAGGASQASPEAWPWAAAASCAWVGAVRP